MKYREKFKRLSIPNQTIVLNALQSFRDDLVCYKSISKEEISNLLIKFFHWMCVRINHFERNGVLSFSFSACYDEETNEHWFYKYTYNYGG